MILARRLARPGGVRVRDRFESPAWTGPFIPEEEVW